MALIVILTAAFVATVLCTPPVAWIAIHKDVLDRPSKDRKIHREPTPLLGGVAVFIAIALAVFEAYTVGWLPGSHIRTKFLIGMGVAGLLLVIGGVLDDIYDLKPWQQLLWPALASVIVIMSGIGVSVVTNPFGGVIRLDAFVIPVVTWDGLPYKLTVLADLFTFVWLMGMTYTTKLLDGLDGLVAGLAGIGGIILALVSLMRDVAQPDTAILAVAVAGAFFGFLIFNFHPAKIFLGESGSTLAGFTLGVLAIISGGKIATTLLVLGLPLFDAVLVISRRLLTGRPLGLGDRSHLHFRMLELGYSHRKTVLFYYLVAALFGGSTLFLQGWQKVIALAIIFIILLLIVSRRRPVKNDHVQHNVVQ